MQQVRQIKAAYDRLVAAYQATIAAAMAKGDTGEVDHVETTRDTLERGVFVLLFGQFERQVTDCFEQARDARAGNTDWTHRRGWDVPIYRNDRVPFETKLTLVLDRNDAVHRRVLRAYAVRNHCAHGGTTEPVGSIDEFVADLSVWQSHLRK